MIPASEGNETVAVTDASPFLTPAKKPWGCFSISGKYMYNYKSANAVLVVDFLLQLFFALHRGLTPADSNIVINADCDRIQE